MDGLRKEAICIRNDCVSFSRLHSLKLEDSPGISDSNFHAHALPPQFHSCARDWFGFGHADCSHNGYNTVLC